MWNREGGGALELPKWMHLVQHPNGDRTTPPPRPPDIYTPRTYTPHNLKCLIWLKHHVFITYSTLKNIYCAGIAFICDVDAVKLSHISCEEGFSPHNCSGSKWALGVGVGGVGWGEAAPISDVKFDKCLCCLS